MDASQFTPEVLALGSSLAKVSATHGASMVTEKIRAMKASGKQAEVISGLEELVQELLSEKAELVRIAQGYKQELTAQSLTPGDLEYITSNILPLIEELVDEDEDDDEDNDRAEKARQMLDKLRPILSYQTVNILQLLGFNFRKAIGEPLTHLIASLISEPTRTSEEVQLKELEHKNLSIQLARDPEAFDRFMKGRGFTWDS